MKEIRSIHFKKRVVLKLISILLLIFPVLCNAQSNIKYTIEGFIKGLNSTNIYMYKKAADKLILDSATVKKGSFLFKGQNPSTTITILFLKNFKDRIVFYNQGGNIKIKSNNGKLKSANIKGVVNNQIHELFTSENKKVDLMLQDSILLKRINQSTLSDNVAFQYEVKKEMGLIYSQKLALDKLYIYSNSKSELSLLFLDKLVFDRNVEELKQMFYSLDAALQQSAKGKEIATKIDELKNTDIGQTAIDFTQKNNMGQNVKLSDFKGQFILLDFWASWCAPCRIENYYLVKMIQKFKNKKFNIVSVSLDKNKSDWVKAIEKDKLTWTQLSDLKMFENEAALKYA